MTAEQRYTKYVFAVTLTLMAAAFAYIPQFHDLEKHPVTGILVGALTGTGLFEAIAKLVEIVFTYIRPIKRWVLGPSYVEGQWAGFYVGKSGQPRLVRERICQDWSSLYMNGQAFHFDGTPHGQWHSLSATVDGGAALLRATMVGDLESGHYDSLVEYQLEGEPPSRRAGSIVDVVSNANAGRVWMRLKKITRDKSEIEALEEARALYREMQSGKAAGKP